MGARYLKNINIIVSKFLTSGTRRTITEMSVQMGIRKTNEKIIAKNILRIVVYCKSKKSEEAKNIIGNVMM